MNAPRLYLVTPMLGETASFARDLDAALAAGDVAAVLLRLEPADERALIDRAKTIAAIVQRRDIALLIDGHPEIAVRAGADGAHLTGVDALTDALKMLKPDRIVGAGGVRSRHDAMVAAEANADYVMFGEPAPYPLAQAAEGGEDRLSFDALLERLAWWVELFQPPCVGYAASLDEVTPLAQVKVDFVALGDWMWTNKQASAAMVEAATTRLAMSGSNVVP